MAWKVCSATDFCIVSCLLRQNDTSSYRINPLLLRPLKNAHTSPGVAYMSSADIKALLEKAFPDSEINIEEGYHNLIEVVSDAFEGVSPVKRQQMVYAPLTDLITGGTLHAVKISAVTPAEKAS